MGINLQTIIGSNLGQAVKDVVGAFKLDPEKKAEFQAAVDANKSIIDQKQLELDGKVQDSVSAEIQSSAEIIKIEAGSQSWLPKNVRPLLMLLWGGGVAANIYLPLIAQIIGHPIQQLMIDPWVYKMTTICVTGYVGFRSLEKIKGADQ